jgi:hypothetical protein
LAVKNDDWRHLPYHIKNVSPLNQDQLEQLPASEETVNRWRTAKKWLTEPYTKMTRPGKFVEADLDEAAVTKMLDCGHCVAFDPSEVKGVVRIFPVPEVQKHRQRIIKHTADLNDLYQRDTLMGTKFLSRQSLIDSVRKGRFAITLDFAAWFDEFELGERVRCYFGFTFKGRTYVLTRLAMGQRQAVDIAAAATDLIMDFPCVGVYRDAHVDNVRFISDDGEALVAAVLTFLQRCETVGATVNEVDPLTRVDHDTVNAMVVTQGTYLGVEFDYAGQRIRVGEKTVKKLEATTAILDSGEFSHRLYLGHMALLFYSSPILNLNVAQHYYAIREYSRISSRLQREPWNLDAPLHMAASRMAVLKKWTREVLRNEWRQVTEKKPTRHVVVVDASKWGWGAVILDLETGAVIQEQEQWGSDYKGRRKSTWAEPEGIKCVILKAFSKEARTRVLVLTDSAAAKGAFGKGRSMVYALNKAILCVAQERPRARVGSQAHQGNPQPRR